MPQPDEIVLILEGPNSPAKSHLAETLQDLLLTMGYQVAPDPEHGFFTPSGFRSRTNLPPIRMEEYDPAVEEMIGQEVKKQCTNQ